jgi:heterodisulfide reductase subunit D
LKETDTPLKNSSLEYFKEDVQKCMRCGFCVALCPVEEYMGFESNSPRGRMQTIKALIDGDLRVNEYLMTRLYNCALCGYCKWRCPPGVNTVDAIQETRAYFVANNCYPDIHAEFAQRITKYNNPYAEQQTKRLLWMSTSQKLPKKAEVIYFVGCTSALRSPEIAESTFQLLGNANVDFTVIPEEICCGSIMLRTGNTEMSKRLAEKNIEMIEASGASTIVFSCPGCYKTFSTDYPNLLKESLDFELKHISEYLIEMDQLQFSKPIKRRVVYHDPCHLGRHLEIFEPPREIINRIPGVELVEMERSKMTSFCCGAGGGVRGAYPDISLQIAEKRVEEATATQAMILSSACPFCKRNLKDAVKERKKTIKVHDIVELAARSIKKT